MTPFLWEGNRAVRPARFSCGVPGDARRALDALSNLLFRFELEMVPVRGYAKEGDTENVEFVGIAA